MIRNIYLALGDSVTAGYGATHPNLAFVRQVSDFVQKNSSAERTIVVARNGWTTKDIWNAAVSLHSSVWQGTNVLTLMAGGNDLRRLLRRQFLPISGPAITPPLVAQRLQEFGFHMDRLCDFISGQQIPRVVIATIYNPVPNFPLAVHAMQGLNGIAREIAEHHHFDVVDVHNKFLDNEAYFIDGYRSGQFADLASPVRRPIHPNNSGHRQIADLIKEQLSEDAPPRQHSSVTGRTVSRRRRQTTPSGVAFRSDV